MVKMAHGRFPVPPRLLTELLKGVPFYSTDIKGELLTPTGAAIITTVCNEYGPIPQMTTESMGYGAGARVSGLSERAARVGWERLGLINATDERCGCWKQISTMRRRRSSDTSWTACSSWALDCFFTPVQMKKNRPGVLLSVLCGLDEKRSRHEVVVYGNHHARRSQL